MQLDVKHKVTSFKPFFYSTSKKQLEVLLSVTNVNQVLRYKYDMASEEEENQFKLSKQLGSTIGCHHGPIRGVVIANNDYLLVTYSFDSINVWQVEFNANKKTL